MKGEQRQSSVTLRPYRALCVVCALGADDFSEARYEEVEKVLDIVRQNPDMPITLRCNAHDVYIYQDPCEKDDTPEGADYNRKRDLDVLQRLDLPPGITLPARTLFIRLLNAIKTVSGICGYDVVTSDAWKGCPLARNGNYERGWAKATGSGALNREIRGIISQRGEEEMARSKRESVEEVYKAKEFFLRPHFLLCSVCQYGGGVRPPFPDDNLPEFLEIIRNNPDLSVTLVQGAHPMMCAPCPSAIRKLNACVCGPNGSGGLYNELKDLNVLQKLGLTYGTTMNAKELFKLVFDRIPTITGTCALKGNSPPHSVWWDPCNQLTLPSNYEKGREILINAFA